jgi:hypothetical protein
MRVCPAATTTLAASQAFPYFYLGTSVGTAAGMYLSDTDLEGLIVGPGQFVFLAGSVAQAGLVSASLQFSEVPV